jgi:hypothetical protein
MAAALTVRTFYTVYFSSLDQPRTAEKQSSIGNLKDQASEQGCSSG